MNRRRPHGIIFAVIFLDLLAFGLVIPQLGVYAKLYQASGAIQGVLIASYSVMQFLFAPLLGRWSDRIGRRPVLLVSLATSLLGHLLFALAHNLTLLFASRMIDGLGGANASTAQAYLSDITEPAKRARAMGLIGAAFGLGFVLGPAIGAVVGPWGVARWGVHGGNLAIGGLATLASAVTLLLAALRLPESLPPEARTAGRRPTLLDLPTLREAARHPTLGRLLVIMLVSTSGFAVLHAILTYFIIDALALAVTERTGEATRLTGQVFAWIGVVAILVQGGGIGPLVKRFGEARLVTAGLALMALALTALPTATSVGKILLLVTPLACGNGLLTASLPALITCHSPAGERGGVLGLAQSLGSVGRIVGPLVGGGLYDLGAAVPFRIGAALCAVALLVSLGLPRARPAAEES